MKRRLWIFLVIVLIGMLFAFVLIWGISGLYLAFPDVSAQIFDYFEPFNDAHPAERLGDKIQYWLAYLHFGRLGGRGIPGCGRESLRR